MSGDFQGAEPDEDGGQRPRAAGDRQAAPILTGHRWLPPGRATDAGWAVATSRACQVVFTWGDGNPMRHEVFVLRRVGNRCPNGLAAGALGCGHDEFSLSMKSR